ncbi:MAG: M48 family metallopeptidase [candidate division Zixibacteria bacterium]|nr:M48 family metallopeptidase [candidate division Zixibacteria bacterium]MCI0595228.1 M48 family metallopeptidase [candidate division Zixibacteria bacterium]
MKAPLAALIGRRLLLGLPLLLGAACATTGPGGKKSLVFIGSGTEVSMGKQAEKEVLAQSKVLADTAWQNYVNRVGQSLARSSERKDVRYSFTVLESKEINAFALPGGPLYIYTGLLKLMEDESELAAVLGHEIGHVDGRHAVRQMQPVVGLAAIEALAFGEKTPASRQALNVVLGIALTGYGRGHELEADRFGLSYMQRAGYDPNGAVRMFTKLGGQGERERNVFEKLSASHPETKERIAKLEAEIKTLPSGGKTGRETYQQMKKRLP